jgi:hypothetical protein
MHGRQLPHQAIGLIARRDRVSQLRQNLRTEERQYAAGNPEAAQLRAGSGDGGPGRSA